MHCVSSQSKRAMPVSGAVSVSVAVSPSFKRIFNLLLFLVLSTNIHCVPTWKVRPQDTNIVIGERGQLNCSFDNQGQHNVNWYKYEPDPTILFSNENRITTTDKYLHYSIENQYNLVINSSKKTDDADYECVHTGSGDLRKKVKVTILAEPGEPVLSTNNTTPKEDDYLQLTCASVGGNPKPEVRWYRNNTLLVSDPPVDPQEKFGTTVSHLVRQMTRDDHQAEYNCTFEVPSLPLKSTVQTLDVHYAPRVYFNQNSPYKSISGTSFSVKCEVDAYPTATTQWFKGATQKGSDSTLSINPVDKTDAGTYTCKATNTVRQTEQPYQLNVLYKPVVTIPSGQYEVKETELIEIPCNVDANPPAHIVRWKYGSEVYTGATLTLSNVMRGQAGTYTCEAENTMVPTHGEEQTGKHELSTQLVVQYAPGQGSITGPPTEPTIGHNVTLTCSVDQDGIPSAEFVWHKPFTPTPEVANSITLHKVQLDYNGVYVCRPRNSIGDGINATYTLNVKESPRFMSSGELPIARTVNISDSSVSVQCVIRGRPLPDVTWYHDETKLPVSGPWFTVEKTEGVVDTWSYTATSTLRWRGTSRQPFEQLRIEDAGKYRCVGSNNADGADVQSEMNFIVQYPPEVASVSDKVATDMNSSALLECQSRAVPQPTFQWLNGTTLLSTGGRIEIIHDMVSGDYPYKSVLNITDVYPSDLGDYTCRVVNLLGATDANVHLTVKTPPESPTNVAIKSQTWDSVTLTWEPGFDGGYNQVFKVHYRSPTRDARWIPVTPSYATTFNVTNLYPSTNYSFWIYGENILGPGDYSDNVTTITNDLNINSPSEVNYDPETRTLTFKLPANHCARIELADKDAPWRTYRECEQSPVTIDQEEKFEKIRVKYCLQGRNDVCSEPTIAPIVSPGPDVPVSTIIIVACVCGIIVLVLLGILIFLCIRKRKSAAKQAKYANKHKPNHLHTNGAVDSGIVNPAADDIDLDDPKTGGRYADNQSPYDVYYDSHKMKTHLNGYPADRPPPYNGYSQDDYHSKNIDIPDSDIYNHKNRRKPPTDMMYLDDPDNHSHNLSRSSHGNDPPESGYSTPDPTKHKKIIYEVVV